jgi:hypothetical protein
MPLRSTVRAGRAGCARPIPDTCCSQVCPQPTEARAWLRICLPPTSTPAGGSGRWPEGNQISTRCPIITAQCGHTTRLCARRGWARYGIRDGVVRLMSETFEAAVKFGMRLPELFCGFERAAGEAPIAYPVACLPQAWASGAAFMILQACLGLTIDNECGAIHIERPRLPVGIDHLTLCGLMIGAIKVNLTFQRIGDHVVAYPESDGPSPVPIILPV